MNKRNAKSLILPAKENYEERRYTFPSNINREEKLAEFEISKQLYKPRNRIENSKKILSNMICSDIDYLSSRIKIKPSIKTIMELPITPSSSSSELSSSESESESELINYFSS